MELNVKISLSAETMRCIDRLAEALTGKRPTHIYNTGISTDDIHKADCAACDLSNDTSEEALPTAANDTEETGDSAEGKQEEAVKKYSIDDVREELKRLSGKKGREYAKSFLGNFGASKIGELAEDMYGRFITAARGESDA